jgi:hypothetical protein
LFAGTKCETCEAQRHEERAEDGDDSCERDPHLRLDQLNLSTKRKSSDEFSVVISYFEMKTVKVLKTSLNFLDEFIKKPA